MVSSDVARMSSTEASFRRSSAVLSSAAVMMATRRDRRYRCAADEAPFRGEADLAQIGRRPQFFALHSFHHALGEGLGNQIVVEELTAPDCGSTANFSTFSFFVTVT